MRCPERMQQIYGNSTRQQNSAFRGKILNSCDTNSIAVSPALAFYGHGAGAGSVTKCAMLQCAGFGATYWMAAWQGASCVAMPGFE